jgi:hypothetical protein
MVPLRSFTLFVGSRLDIQKKVLDGQMNEIHAGQHPDKLKELTIQEVGYV